MFLAVRFANYYPKSHESHRQWRPRSGVDGSNGSSAFACFRQAYNGQLTGVMPHVCLCSSSCPKLLGIESFMSIDIPFLVPIKLSLSTVPTLLIDSAHWTWDIHLEALNFNVYHL